MAYSTVKALRMALAPGLADPDDEPSDNTGSAADLPNDDLNAAIAQADSMIDTAIGGRYTTPVAAVDSAVPNPLPFWSVNIAGYLATLTYRGGQDFTDNDPVFRRYAMTAKFLDMVAKGDYTLPLPANSGPAASSGAAGPPINPNGGPLYVGAWESPGDVGGWGDYGYGQSPFMHPLLNPLEGSTDQFEIIQRGVED